MLSSASKLTTCPRSEHLIKFQLKSTAIADSAVTSTLNLGNYLRHGLQSITTKKSGLLQPKMSKMKRYVRKLCRDLH